MVWLGFMAGTKLSIGFQNGFADFIYFTKNCADFVDSPKRTIKEKLAQILTITLNHITISTGSGNCAG